MTSSERTTTHIINSRLSLLPLVEVLQSRLTEKKAGAKLYRSLLNEVKAVPELLQPQTNVALIKQHADVVETLLSTLFPPTTKGTQDLFAVSFPFQLSTIYASDEFKSTFRITDNDNTIHVGDRQTTVDITKTSIALAYNVILHKLYNMPVTLTGNSVHAFTDADTGLRRYYELHLNAQFIDVTFTAGKELPQIPDKEVVPAIEELEELFTLSDFMFDGIFVIEVDDVTDEQVPIEMRNALIDIDAFSDTAIYDQLQAQVESLIRMRGLKIGITPFFKKNNVYLYTDTHFRNSLLFKNTEVKKNKDAVSASCQKMFQQHYEPLLFRQMSDKAQNNELLKYYYDQGAESLILCPLHCDNGNLIGLLEIMSNKTGYLKHQHLKKVKPVIQLFTLALEKVNESLQMQIDKTIKEHFTAIQPAVEWKFTKAAFQFIQNYQQSESAKMPEIAFENVYPLYGSIDIRNSSVERNNSIQLDLLEQLTLAQQVLSKASKVIEFPLLREVQYRINRYIETSSDSLLSDDEIQIYDFLHHQLNPMMRNLIIMRPELKKTLDSYFSELDEERNIVFHHRKNYEDSITRINEVLDRFIDQEQKHAQDIYPHYFERYFTDGVEFNIYIGQSLSPQKPFNEMYVRNLKLWQLTFLAKAVRITEQLKKRLPLPLETTQLILAQAIPLSISFRRKERKFDVDGAYNIRYEIVKKRIDKVHLRDSEERLTQPGTIAIVYSQQKELNEYLEYIEFLQNEKMLGENVEHLELEDTQGISGLKAIRVNVTLDVEKPAPKEPYNKLLKEQLHK